MMTFSVKEAYAIHEAMSNHIVSGRTIKGKAGLAFSYNFRLIHDAMGEYITRRDEIIAKYADKNPSDGMSPVAITITDPENLKKANAEIAEMEDLKIEIPIMEISIDDILSTDGIDSADMQMLIWMTKEYRIDKKKISKVK